MIYGNYDLRRGDNDGNPASNSPPRWGGTNNPPPPAATAQTPQNQAGATIAVPQHVRQLQNDLRTLGFLFVTNADGAFGAGTDWAVREFQIYAGMANVARINDARLHGWQPQAGITAPEVAALGTRPHSNPPESYYVSSLDRVTNNARYTGPISGIVNSATRNAIEHWLRNNYRCPVVIEAWQVNPSNGQRTTVATNGVNIWNYNEITQAIIRNAANQVIARVRMFSRDFTGHYTFPATRNQDHYQSLGGYARYTTYGGPQSEVPNHTWIEAEMTPERLIGPASTIATLAASPDGATASTYRVVRATSEQECMGMFDSINAYDDALISLGPCHWTMGLMPQGGYDNGELPGFLSYFLHRNQADYQRVLGNFGLYPSSAWAGANVGPLWNQTGRKYTGWIRQHNEQTQVAQAPTILAQAAQVNQQLPMVDRAPAEANYFKTWHWFYRFAMAGRTVASMQQSMWDMVRMRIRDLRGVAISVQAGTIQVNSTLGEFYTSEKAIGILLRWHIYRPAHVTGQRVRDSLISAINGHPQLNWNIAPAQWTDAHELAITEQLLADAIAVNDTQDRLASWPTYAGRNGRQYTLNNELGSLRTGRRSFHFDTTGI
ncbi:peptidoglycan-binding domain-containing protein [Xanthomonas translucens]|uniref:peptidoglycan-binding domain-containing protein n=1 Tax=Xanthomonas campestris pv. translucens TaxID=343 RepID=UPI0009BF7618|nr:peptidoglycan-binding protein [Xanthomonas translucens]MCT8276510.1 peptidoglycan-binding protein [Xanthomonas translucens pv. translucens]MCT8280295.1 peptidoglycan-binding protein [Xanthomonas translucens pv. translucens]MCT8309224.1 peptidoglycan-binding protein [Xanthomonas translucens pv. translucens]WNJ27187.1 peptidoglycan-binding domain-containing protein [Xanthomonas translucens pv. translucens]